MTDPGEGFTAPPALLLFGEGLQRMTLAQYTHFVNYIGGLGMQVAVRQPAGDFIIPQADVLEPEQTFEPAVQPEANVSTSETAEEPQLRLLLLSRENLEANASAGGFNSGLVTRGLNVISSRLRVFPETEEGIRRSRRYDKNAPVGFYDPRLLTPEYMKRFTEQAVNPDDGIVSSSLYRSMKEPGYEAYRCAIRLGILSRLDILSLRRYVEGPVFIEEDYIGKSTVDHLSRLLQTIEATMTAAPAPQPDA